MTMNVNEEGLDRLQMVMNVDEFAPAKKAFGELIKGNELFVKNRGEYYSDVKNSSSEEASELYQFSKGLNSELAEIEHHQTPTKAVLACSDSRVTPGVIFSHVGFNMIFEVRNAGNIFTKEAEESMVVPASHDTPLMVICGHYKCGAMNACATQRKTQQMNEAMPATVANLEAVAPKGITDADKIAEYNVANVVYRFANSANPVLKSVFTGKKMKIAAAMYDIDSGKVNFMDFALVKKMLLDNSHE